LPLRYCDDSRFPAPSHPARHRPQSALDGRKKTTKVKNQINETPSNDDWNSYMQSNKFFDRVLQTLIFCTLNFRAHAHAHAPDARADADADDTRVDGCACATAAAAACAPDSAAVAV
jgi:hypothetical protein